MPYYLIIVGSLITIVGVTPGSEYLNQMAMECSFSVQAYQAELVFHIFNK
jgi:hypothetical protein